MKKLGYTFYPKDWNTSEAVFQLDLKARGLYRELIDLAMFNDNHTKIKISVWVRKFNTNEAELDKILKFLNELELIKIDKDYLFIPSCEERLKLVRAGRKGGKVRQTNKAAKKPVKKVKPVNLDIKKELLNSKTWIDKVSMTSKRQDVEAKLKKFISQQELTDGLDRSLNEVKKHFLNWINKQPIESNNSFDASFYKS